MERASTRAKPEAPTALRCPVWHHERRNQLRASIAQPKSVGTVVDAHLLRVVRAGDLGPRIYDDEPPVWVRVEEHAQPVACTGLAKRRWVGTYVAEDETEPIGAAVDALTTRAASAAKLRVEHCTEGACVAPVQRADTEQHAAARLARRVEREVQHAGCHVGVAAQVVLGHLHAAAVSHPVGALVGVEDEAGHSPRGISQRARHRRVRRDTRERPTVGASGGRHAGLAKTAVPRVRHGESAADDHGGATVAGPEARREGEEYRRRVVGEGGAGCGVIVPGVERELEG
eukprot:scaffold26940_cov117-Phaeocystis_antarctica.AAC.21